MTETGFAKEMEEQIYSYIDLCAKYELQPNVWGFIEHLEESYEQH